MKSRTGSALPGLKAQLQGYRVEFNKRGRDGTGKANIVPDEASTVWGVVYECSPNELEKLDRYEGVDSGHYVRKAVVVQLENGEQIDAITYVAGERFIGDSLRPSPEYLQTILDGAREHGLPDWYIERLQEKGSMLG
jgi:cation transport regulator ChaC